ncbi:MAG: hypothetical protein WC154_00215 [Candidatus Izemoplasmatales bacterium]
MKVTINGSISKNALKTKLQEQKEKVQIIDEFCKTNKQNSFSYKDAELEYEYKKQEKQSTKKVEVRDGKNKGN